MKLRCLNPNRRDFQWYGERGVQVCPRWVLSFDAFLEDMGPRPEGMTLDRIDPNGHYEPGNCRWATILHQANNRVGDSQYGDLMGGEAEPPPEYQVVPKWPELLVRPEPTVAAEDMPF